MTELTAGPGRHLVLWDGDCGFCRRFVGWVRSHGDERIETVPYQAIPEPPMTPALREACARALHVVTADGALLRGADAVLFVYGVLGYRLAALGRRRPFLWILEIGYRWVARNRRLISRWFFRRERPEFTQGQRR